MNTRELKNYLNNNYTVATEKWRRRNAYYYKDILRLIRYAVPRDSDVLQIGVNDGWLLHELNPKKAVFLALSPAIAHRGKELYPDIEFFEDGLEGELTLAGKFDYIILVNLLGLLPDIQAYLSRLHKVCGPSTRLVLTYYNYLWEPVVKLAEFLRIKQKQPVQNWLTEADIQNLLKLSGFEVVRSGRRQLLPKYIPVLSFLLNEFFAKLPLFNRLCFWNYVIVRPRPISTGFADYQVSVIVPARNEKGNIASIVERVPQMGAGTELVFVEGGSTDGTWEEIQKAVSSPSNHLRKIALRQSGRGKGDAVRLGFEKAGGDILMVLDADLTVDPAELPRFYEVLAKGQAEYAQGTRLVYPMEKGAMRFLNLLGNKFFSALFSWLLKQRIRDTLCGTKVLFAKDYRRLSVARDYFGNFDPFGDFDLIFGASKLGLNFAEIPVHYLPRQYGETNISRFRHGWLLLKMCIFAFLKLE